MHGSEKVKLIKYRSGQNTLELAHSRFYFHFNNSIVFTEISVEHIL